MTTIDVGEGDGKPSITDSSPEQALDFLFCWSDEIEREFRPATMPAYQTEHVFAANVAGRWKSQPTLMETTEEAHTLIDDTMKLTAMLRKTAIEHPWSWEFLDQVDEAALIVWKHAEPPF